MQYEITPATEWACDLIVTYHDDYYDEEAISLGLKHFIEIGQFKYEWFITGMSADDAESLIEALQTAVTTVRSAT